MKTRSEATKAARPLDRLVGRRVVCAANRNPANGKLLLGARHFDPLMHATAGPNAKLYTEQGFIDQGGTFMDRREAWKVAEAANQIIRRFGCDGVLYSENLY